jgi:hypothetical protein
MILSAPLTQRYSINTIKEEACNLVETGLINLNQPLYVLYQYLPIREWVGIECELERWNFLMRDRIVDLIGDLQWDND